MALLVTARDPPACPKSLARHQMERTAVFRAAVRSETMGHRWQVAESASAGSQVLAGQLPELATIGLPRPAALRQNRPLSQSSYFYGPTIKNKRPRGHYTAWPLRDCPPRPSRDSVSGRIVCGWRCLSRV